MVKKKKINTNSGQIIQIDPSLQALPEWTAYNTNPSRDTFLALMTTVRNLNPILSTITSLYAFFLKNPHWKTAQHLSLLFEDILHTTYAEYFAYKALSLSGGNVWARLCVAKVLWERRLTDHYCCYRLQHTFDPLAIWKKSVRFEV